MVGVGVTVTVTVVVIVMNSGDAVSTHEGNKQYLSPEALATYSNMKADPYLFVYLVKLMMEKNKEKELFLVFQLFVMEEKQ